MKPETGDSIPDTADLHQRYFALAMLLAGLYYGAEAASHLAGGRVAEWFEWAEIAFILSAVGLVLSVMIWKLRNARSQGRHLEFGPDGFVAEVLDRSARVAWGSTFVFVSLLAPISKSFPALPAEFFLKLVAAVALVTAASTFLYLSHTPADGDEEIPLA